MAESSKAVYAALAGNTAVATTKLIAAAATGRSDAANEFLLLFGNKRSKLPPDEAHPFGHGQELCFWTLIVFLIIFTGGGAVSIYDGVRRLLQPQAPEESIWSDVVLGALRRCLREAVSRSATASSERLTQTGHSQRIRLSSPAASKMRATWWASRSPFWASFSPLAYSH
jgi:divalent metal cation (Fe/Co/Zn/Cd) transporter